MNSSSKRTFALGNGPDLHNACAGISKDRDRSYGQRVGQSKLHNEIARIIVENAYDGYVLKTSTASSDELAGDNRRRRGP